jgi:hypothetical protein
VLASAAITFDHQWHYYLGSGGESVEQLPDLSYVVGAHSQVDSVGYGVTIITTDTLGDTTSVHHLIGTDGGGGHLCRVADGGYVVTGTRDTRHLFAIKYSAAGDSVWGYESASRGIISAVIATDDTGCLIVGRLPEPSYNFGAVRLDASGHEEWVRTYNEPLVYETWAHGADRTTSGGYILCGNGDDYMDVYPRLVRIDSAGSVVWSRLYFRGVEPSVEAVRETPDHGFLATGYDLDTSGYNYALLLLRVDSAGNELWTRQVAVPSASTKGTALAAAVTGYVVAGTVDWGDSARVWLVRLNEQADTLWTRILPGAGREAATDVKPANTEGFIITGTSDSAGGSILLIKTDSLGLLYTVVAEGQERGQPRFSLSVTPNPARSIARVQWPNSMAGRRWLIMIDADGRMVRDVDVAGAASTDVSLVGLPPGVYLVRLTVGGSILTRKLVVER